MNTTSLYVEQVLIGSMALVMLALPFWPDLPAQFHELSAPEAISAGAGLIGAVYVLGILFDRFADSLLERLGRHNRVRFALSGKKSVSVPWTDPLPQDALQVRVVQAGGAAYAWMDYHRARIRLARALAVFAPGATFSAVLLQSRLSDSGVALSWQFAVVPLAYFTAFVGASLAPRSARLTSARPRSIDTADSSGQIEVRAGTARTSTLHVHLARLMRPAPHTSDEERVVAYLRERGATLGGAAALHAFRSGC